MPVTIDAPGSALSAEQLAERLGATGAEGIRRALGDLIASGALPPGARLPTIRAVAGALGASVGAVADAWSELRREGLLETRRRGGTIVAARPAERPAADPRGMVTLAGARPDPALLPRLDAALAAALEGDAGLSSRTPIVPALRDAVAARFGARGAEMIAAAGAASAMHLVLSELARGSGDGRVPLAAVMKAGFGQEVGHDPGRPAGEVGMRGADVPLAAVAGAGFGQEVGHQPGEVAVAIEDPTCNRNRGILAGLGARPVPFASDAEGPVVEAVRDALAAEPAVVTFQTAAAVPLGSTLTPRRRDALADALAGSGAWIVEEHSAGGLVDGATLADVLPERVIRVIDLSRGYGPRLQTAVVIGPAAALERIAARQAREGARPNPLLQGALARVMADAGPVVAHAARVYRARGAALHRALAARGVRAAGDGGFFAWVAVRDERDALLALAEEGIAASAGSRGTFAPGEPRIRIATTRLPDDAAEIGALADAIARAAEWQLTTEDE
ncbi:GntR family transcriptional regulator [Microbacterium rhizophilus]|uniref:GntR family transcriptional regulator n=1 Tax=Microbacterium rhizophilus TaxID=3138934 RepID=UPI0031EC191B